MKFSETPLQGAFLVELDPLGDARGWFMRTYCKHEFSKVGFHEEFLQINQSFNRERGTFRGLHYQLPPMHETKLVRCVTGAVSDVIVDLRRGSSTFLKHFTFELSAEKKNMVLIPGGFAHGFLTLTENASLIYHHTQVYNKESERMIRCDDPLLNIQLPQPVSVITARDQSGEFLSKDFQGIEIPR